MRKCFFKKRIALVLAGLILFSGISSQITVQAEVSDQNQMYLSGDKNLRMELVSASSKVIKVKMINTEDTAGGYSKVFNLYKWEDKRWKKVKRISMVPKCLFPVKGSGSKVEKLICKEHFGKNLQKGKYKLKWVGSKCFTIK